MEFFNKLKENDLYNKWFRTPYSYVTGAVLLSLFQIVMLAATGSPWGVSATFANWGAWLYQLVGGSVEKWYYFTGPGAPGSLNALEAGFMSNSGTMLNLGVIFGALLSTLLASQFKIKKIKNKRQIVAAISGGLMMGYGARIAYGCNIGALFGGISSLSLSGWVFATFMFVGAVIGSKLLVKYFM